MAEKQSKLFKEVKQYCYDVIDGKVIANEMRVLACRRFLADLDNPLWEMRTKNADFVIALIENTFYHRQGPLAGQLFKMEKWQKFCAYNIAGFYIKDTDERRFKEALICIPRKNAKTFFASALAWALSVLDMPASAKVYIVATKTDRALEAFDNINYTIAKNGFDEEFRIKNNNAEHSIEKQCTVGGIKIQALAADSKRADGLNGNIFILDEIHAYRSSNDYYVYKQAMKAYINKLLIGITTAGNEINTFFYNRLIYCKEVLQGLKTDDEYFIFICESDNIDDYTNPIEHEKANPNYGVTIRPQDILNESLQAQNDPTGRAEFINKSLNRYTNSMTAYFNIEKVKESDKKYNWTLKELAKLPITWYGGADLSKLYDLTGACLHGRYEGVDIVVAHAFIPVVTAHDKAEQDNIPFFLWRDRGWLTLCNNEVIEYEDVVQWFLDMRKLGFKINCVGYDQRYAQEFVLKMKKAGFKMKNQMQRYVEKTEGFRHIEKQIRLGNYYYCHNLAYEYCIGNVKAIEDSDEFIRFEKIMPTQRIDLFDADVIATKQMLKIDNKNAVAKGWFDNGG